MSLDVAKCLWGDRIFPGWEPLLQMFLLFRLSAIENLDIFDLSFSSLIYFEERKYKGKVIDLPEYDFKS